MNTTELTTEEILIKIETINRTRQETINGIRGASILHELLHEELDRRDYRGGRPSRILNPTYRRK